jgi:hypothetical protein
MAINGAAIAYSVAGGLILYSGIKGATISDTVRSALGGNLNPATTEEITAPAGSSGNAGGKPGSKANVSSGSNRDNLLTAAEYLMANGYSRAAAAGIAGCISGESSGDPEAIGDQGTSFGLIQEHGSQYADLVTGNRTADFDRQLPAIIAYNNAQGEGLIRMLNSISDPVAAANFYSENFERPAVTDSDVRPADARWVYQQLGKGAR